MAMDSNLFRYSFYFSKNSTVSKMQSLSRKSFGVLEPIYANLGIIYVRPVNIKLQVPFLKSWPNSDEWRRVVFDM